MDLGPDVQEGGELAEHLAEGQIGGGLLDVGGDLGRQPGLRVCHQATPAGIVGELAVAVRRLHDVGRTGKELVVPCVMLLLLPIAFAFQGILPKIVALGYLGITLLVFANLLLLFTKKGSTIPNRYGAAPTAFSFAR